MAKTRKTRGSGPYLELGGGRRLHYLVVDQVRRLLALSTLTRREIARRAGCSRDSVGLIADGHLAMAASHSVYLDDGERVVEVAVRCAEGHLVYVLPCRTCRAEAYKKAGRSAEASTIGRPLLRAKLDRRPERNGEAH